MKTKLLLLLGAAVAVCSLTSCDIYGYPGSYGYGYGNSYARPSYYSSSYSSRPLLSYSSYSGGYSRPYSYGSSYCASPYSSIGSYGYNRGGFGSPFGFNSGFSPFGFGSFGSSYGSGFGGGFGGSSFVGHHHHCR